MGNSVFNTLKLGAVVVAGAMLAAPIMTPAMANDTLDLLAKGYQLRVVPAEGASFTVTFSSDGTYKTTLGSRGTWRVEGDMLCTVRASDKRASCGVIPSSKKDGDAWATKDGDRNSLTVTILAPTKAGGG